MIATVGGAGAATKAGGGCAGADDAATDVSVRDLRKAVHCLIDKERASHGRKELDRDGRLAKTAKKHVNVMVATNCLDHACGNEAPLETRIRNTGYFSGARDYNYAENVGCEQTVAQMVKNWMGSTIHRRNILNRKFDDIGVGADHGRVPSRCDAGFVTFAIVFGYRAG